MRQLPSNAGWTTRVATALGVILLTAVVARGALWLLAPLIPMALVGLLLIGLYRLVIGRR